MKRVVLSAVMAFGCSKTVEEPTPVRPDPAPVVKATASRGERTATGTASPTNPLPTNPPPIGKMSCPPDPHPEALALFGHGKAGFVTPDGKNHEFAMELAKTAAAQERGLMFRTSLAEDAGMVFEFARAHEASFWMHNTCIALDMVFVGENNRVIGVVTAPPLSDDPRGVSGLSKWVVELAAGVAKKRGIAIGTEFVPPK